MPVTFCAALIRAWCDSCLSLPSLLSHICCIDDTYTAVQAVRVSFQSIDSDNFEYMRRLESESRAEVLHVACQSDHP